jgi:hypothetical protein
MQLPPAATPHKSQGKLAAQPLSGQAKREAPFAKGSLRVVQGLKIPLVPDHHRSRTVNLRRDDPLEVGLNQRMVLDELGKTFIGGIHRGAFRHRP